jgi:RNA 2',3'-cyclic 3'-phosphodiesterase
VTRLFIGLELPQQVKFQIDSQISSIKNKLKKWELPHDYHQTLLFIGEVSDSDQEMIMARLSGLTFKSFELELAQFDFFKRRIMYISFTHSSELLDLKRKVDDHFSEWSKKVEKDFIPHVTIKRWQRYEYDTLASAVMKNPFSPIKFVVDEVALFKSEKDHFGQKYHVISRIRSCYDRPS